MRRAQGYVIVQDDRGVAHEADTFTCCHCQRVVEVKPLAPPSEAGGWCAKCNGLICTPCTSRGCVPFAKKLAKWEAREAARRSYGL